MGGLYMGMDINLNTSFHPFRLALDKRGPVELTVDLINRSKESKRFTMELLLSRDLALDKGGLKSGAVERLDRVEPGERKQFYYKIFPKQMIKDGEYPVRLTVLEHYKDDYNYVQNELIRNLNLTVSEH